ncbi:MAG: alpha/beta hydrolase [Deltaproteobacteria bacterium]|nr:alpha/beta hydrolase [Deltaproteobacteria bacterium]
MIDIKRETTRVAGQGGLELALHRFVAPTATPSGTTLLCLHGFLDAGATWDRVAAPLAGIGHEVLALDFRGFGESESVGRGGYLHFPDYVADVDAVVRALDRPKLVLVGHSMGGTVACLYAGARSERLVQLVLVEGLGPPAMSHEQGLFRMRQWLTDLERPPTPRTLRSHEDAVRRLAMNHPAVPRELLELRARQLTRPSDDELVWSHDPMHRTTSPMPFSVEALKAFLRAIRVPVLHVGGGPTGFHPEDEDERLAAIPEVTRVELEGAGHMVHWTRPAELAAAIDAFMAAPRR